MPVINPCVFYLMHVADGVGIVCTATAIAALAGSIIYLAFCAADMSTPNWKVVKVAWVAFVVTAAVAVFVPDSKTITKMIVAQNVTYERVEDAADTVQKVYDDIMGLFEEGG